MSKYYVNKNAQSNGDHEVHKEGCQWMPSPENRTYLGVFLNCSDALREAKKKYLLSDGCAHCCSACHRR